MEVLRKINEAITTGTFESHVVEGIKAAITNVELSGVVSHWTSDVEGGGKFGVIQFQTTIDGYNQDGKVTFKYDVSAEVNYNPNSGKFFLTDVSDAGNSGAYEEQYSGRLSEIDLDLVGSIVVEKSKPYLKYTMHRLIAERQEEIMSEMGVEQ